MMNNSKGNSAKRVLLFMRLQTEPSEIYLLGDVYF